jgi:hypothetical protein
MTQADNLEFKLTVPMEKSLHAGTDGWFIKGVAAGVDFVDKTGDEMLPEAIQKLAAQINESPVPLRNQHKRDDIMEDLGNVVKATVTPEFDLEVEAELDQDNPQAEYLWKKLGKGKKYGLSVRGDSERPIIEKSVSGYHSKHHSVFLKEVSVTTRPYFTHSLGTVLRKAIDEANAPLATGENTTMEDSIKTGEATKQESSAPENDTAQASPSDELVKSLLADDKFTTLIADTVKSAVEAQAPVVDNTEVAKSETEDEASSEVDVAELVKSVATELNASMDEKIETMLSRIADVATPAILEKSEAEEAKEAISAFNDTDARNRLRVGLAAMRGETDKL